MGQVTTVREVKTHQTAVNGHDGLVDLQVGRRSRKALDVDTPLVRIEVEGLESTLLAKKLDLVNVLVATIVTGARKTLGVLVGHGRTESIEDGTGSDVLRSNENNGLALTLDLIFLQEEGVESATEARRLAIANKEKQNKKKAGQQNNYHDGGDLGVRFDKRLLQHLQFTVSIFDDRLGDGGGESEIG